MRFDIDLCKTLRETNFVTIFFFQNSIFHPYLSLQQMELLKSTQVRSFLVGASNYLYRRQKGLSEVLVDVSTKSYVLSAALHLQRKTSKYPDFSNFLNWWAVNCNFNKAFTLQITALYFYIFLILHLKNV